MDPTTQEAVSLLERLRKLAETWTEWPGTPPGLYNLPLHGRPYMFERLGFEPAVEALCRLDYYDQARGRDEAVALIDAAIKALREGT